MMSWMQKLVATYDACVGNMQISDSVALCPVGFCIQPVELEIVLDGQGNFLSASAVPKKASIPIPCTVKSATRTGKKPESHPLCDKLQYIAADFRAYGGKVTSGFAAKEKEPHESYKRQLTDWVDKCPHPKTAAILAYVKKGEVMQDLVKHRVLPVTEDHKILVLTTEKGNELAELKKKFPILNYSKTPYNVFVRWQVQIPGQADDTVWADKTIYDSWLSYIVSCMDKRAMCMVTGETMFLASSHPKKIFGGAANAKLISANDKAGFTFRGRFTDTTGLQACSVGYETTQKAHGALSWLVARQGNSSGSQVYVCWAVSGAKMPQVLASTQEMLWDWDAALPPDDERTPSECPVQPDYTRNAGQAFALKLRNMMRGYGRAATEGLSRDVVVMGLDAATPGRMSVIYYRELLASELLERLERWHLEFAWRQFGSLTPKGDGKSLSDWAVYAPAPDAVARAVYGARVDEKLKNQVRNRLTACIVDGVPLPEDLLHCCVRRAISLAGQSRKDLEWKQTLGIACALYRGFYARKVKQQERREYRMALEEDRTSRDYLYGRLLALAERMESVALHVADEKRNTTAERLMQRFADHPCATWRTIELALRPYVQRLRVSCPGFLYIMNQQMNAVMSAFMGDDFTREGKLSGEFLLGYHCQLQALTTKKQSDTEESHEQPTAQN